jgi:periplasmic divalent cation tolerance protein
MFFSVPIEGKDPIIKKIQRLFPLQEVASSIYRRYTEFKARSAGVEKTMEYRSIYITVPDEEAARNLGRTLVEEHLIACANYFPINSIYRWRGEIQEVGEAAIIAKTRVELVDNLVKRVNELHSYEVPCVVSWIIEKGNPGYLEWIGESTV